MARPPRQELAGAVHHVIARGNAREALFRDDRDRRQYLRLLDETVQRAAWVVIAYCLMTNHIHLLIETPMANLGDGMRWFHGHYGRYFNDRHDRVGHVFQGRYKAVRQATDDQLLRTRAYIATNPVTAGLCAHPDEYAWRWDGIGAAGFEPRPAPAARRRCARRSC